MNLNIGIFSSDFAKKGLFEDENEAWGGVGEMVYHLAKGLEKYGHSVEVFTTGKSTTHITHGNITLHEFRPTASVSGTPVSLQYMYEHLSESLDLVHAHRGLPSGAIAGFIHAAISGIPLVMTVHGDIHYQQNAWIRNGLLKFFEFSSPYMLANSDKITTVSEVFLNNSRYLKDFRSETAVIPNGVEIPSDTINRKSARNKLGINSNNYIILYLGSLEPRKNPGLLVNAMPTILEANPNTQALIVGGGNRIDELTKQAKEIGVRDSITFTGFVPEDRKSTIYSASDIFCLPSQSESFGLTAFEAAAHGLPVILGNIPVFRNLFAEGAMYVNPQDSDQLASVIASLLSSKSNREKLANQSYNQLLDYSWENITGQYIDIYKSVLNESHAHQKNFEYPISFFK